PATVQRFIASRRFHRKSRKAQRRQGSRRARKGDPSPALRAVRSALGEMTKRRGSAVVGADLTTRYSHTKLLCVRWFGSSFGGLGMRPAGLAVNVGERP